jgi:AAA domain-containing protein
MSVDVAAAKRKPISDLTAEERMAIWKSEQPTTALRGPEPKVQIRREAPAKDSDWSDPQTPANAETASRTRVDIALSRIVTAQTILSTHYPEPKWAVKGLIPEGVTFVAGAPKLGKSIFALNLGVAVAEDGKALSHFDADLGSVLYLALEDGPRRIQERLLKLTNGRISDKLHVVTEWPRLDQGGLEAIDAWIERHEDARLLIVDTLKMLRPLPTGRDRNAYDADYEAIQPLTKIASQRVALLIVHHTRKAIADDPLATVSGSYGLTGAADGVLVLSRRRGSGSATLNVIGRDVEEQELALEFKPNLCLWSVLGKSEDVRRSTESQQILDLLKQSGEPLAPAEIAALLDKQPVSTRTLLFKMRDRSEIALFGKKYQLPDYQPAEKSVPAFPRTKNTGNAPKTEKERGLTTKRSRVPSVTQGEQIESVDGVGTRERSTPKASAANGLLAFPVKSVPGNAGTLHDEEVF